MEDRELRTELSRIEQRLIDFMVRYESEKHVVKEQLYEYKETVKAKHLEMNEVRNQISEERGQFALRSYADSRIDAVSDRLNRLEKDLSGINGRMLGLGMGLTVIMFLIEVAFKIWK